MPHDVLVEAREEYQKIKKARAVKAITYVLVEKPHLFKDKPFYGAIDLGKSEISGGGGTRMRKDSMSQYSDAQFQSRSLRRPSFRSGGQASMLSNLPNAKLKAQLGGLRSGDQSPGKLSVNQRYNNNIHTRNSTLKEPYLTQKLPTEKLPAFISSMLENSNSQKQMVSPAKVSFLIKQAEDKSTARPILQQQQRTKSTLIKMVKVRQNLEKQANTLIERFEEKLKLQEQRAKRAREAKENQDYERQAYFQKRQQFQTASRERRRSQLLNSERKSIESFHSSITEVKSRESSKRQRDQLISQRDFEEYNRTHRGGYQRARSHSQSNEVEKSLESINGRIQAHQEKMRSNLNSLSQSMREHNEFVQRIKNDFDEKYRQFRDESLLKTIQKHIKEDRTVKTTRLDQSYELDAYKEKRAEKFQRAFDNITNIKSAKVDKNEKILQRQIDNSHYVSDMKSSRNHDIMVRQQLGRFQSAEVTQKLKTLRNEKLSQSKNILQRHQAIEEKRRKFREQTHQSSIYYQTQGQGGQEDQLEHQLSLRDRLLLDSECGKKAYLGPSRIPLNVGNPLLKDVSLYYCGVKKFKPKPVKSQPDVKGTLGNFIINKLLKF
ncbi:hypothetical protein FGO68_gene12944 [Halteria grandinella]|uniref:Uncharacterized protein n=1 Tax=Halteria grandinella TaxID=5974 RepID=A0A8J8T986_HALGN|nr:hypothetical protein FGO68_gene12944 [Halteria grandinella]